MNKSVCTFIVSIVFLFHFQSLSGYNLKAIKTTNTAMITSIIQDESNFLWIGGSDGLLRFDSYAPIPINDGINEESIGYIKKIYKSDEEHTFLLATNEGLFSYNYIIDEFKIVNECLRGYDVKSIILSHDKQWYVATNHGVYIFNEQFEYINVITTKSGLVNEQINTIVEDKDNNILIASSGGIDRLIKDAQGNYNVVSVLKGGGVRFLVIDKNDDIWYNVNGKIYWAHRKAWLNHVAKEAHNISDNIECVVAIDLQNEVWVGTRGNGILRYEITAGKDPQILPSILIDESRNAEISNSILSLYQDTNKDIWIGSINGLYLYTYWDSTFKTIKHSDRNPNTLSINMVSSIYAAPDNTIWLGTSYGINSLSWDKNHTQYSIKHYIDTSDDNDIIGQNRILMIAPCSDTQFLISTKLGLKYFNSITKTYFTTDNLTEAYSKHGMRYVRSYYTSPTGDIYMAFNEGGIGVWLKSQETFVPIRWEGKASGIYRGIVQDQSGKLWVAADGEGVYCLTLSDDKQSVQHEELYSKTQFNNQYVTNLHIDSKHTIWAGTFNGLFSMNIEQKSFEAFPLSQSNTPLYISSINEDKDQHIWVSSIRGIYKIASRESVSYYEVDNKSDISKLWYIIGHDRDEEGNIYIGGTNGLIYYNPSFINLDRRTIQPYISRLLIDNTPDFVNCQKLNYSDNVVTIPSNSKQIVFEISSLYYPNPHVIRYAYKLDGVDNEWIYTDSYHRSISYNNLPSGNYSLLVKSTTPSGKWSDNIASFEFIVKPSPYMSWYAILIYIVLGAFVIFIIVKFFMLKIKANRDKALNYWKIKNFVNITNGLRTPLTLLHAPIEYFINHYGEIPDSEAKSLLHIMRKNVKTMSDQIDSFIELSKSEAENAILRLQSIDLGTLITNIFNSLRNRAELKNISYEMNINIKDIKTVVDPTKIEVVLFNLLNNSIRMVPENGKITLSCYLDKKKYSYRIKISDNSTFYEKAKTLSFMGEQTLLRGDKYTNEIFKSEFSHLSVVYDFIQLHKGKLSIVCNENGGTDYEVVILLGISHYSAEQLTSLETPKDDVYSHYQEFSSPHENIPNQEKLDLEQLPINDANIPSIIGIDCNTDLLSLVKTELVGEYKLIGYPFDKNIINKIKRHKCSAVIIDIPNKDAASLRLISMLKKESSLANIPIVVFSANAYDDFEHFCYDLGVDIWLKKPFDLKYFHTRIKNIIKSREKMTEIIKQKLIVNPKEINILSNNEVFLANVMEVIERNMSNEGFAVEMLAAELNISHSALYRKLLQLTEQTPVDFIRTIRLKRAAQLLLSHNYLVSEVCLMVGFSDQRYFSTCFKRLYGIGPKAYSLDKNDENHSEEKG